MTDCLTDDFALKITEASGEAVRLLFDGGQKDRVKLRILGLHQVGDLMHVSSRTATDPGNQHRACHADDRGDGEASVEDASGLLADEVDHADEGRCRYPHDAHAAPEVKRSQAMGNTVEMADKFAIHYCASPKS